MRRLAVLSTCQNEPVTKCTRPFLEGAGFGSMGNELAVLGVVPVPGKYRTYEVVIEWNAQESRFRFVVSDGPPRVAEGDRGWVEFERSYPGAFRSIAEAVFEMDDRRKR